MMVDAVRLNAMLAVLLAALSVVNGAVLYAYF
jgi:hypothetical protein